MQLSEQGAQVWRVSLKQDAAALIEFQRILDDDERRRAERFRFEKDRAHYLAARGALRLLLSRYLDVPPEAVVLEYNAYGKPSLSAAFAARDLRFNLSHSGELALYAFTHGRDVGVDIEWTGRHLDQPEQIAERYFSPAERAALRRLPDELKRQGFFNAWTRKEAYIKARGMGLYLALDQFDVSLDPAQPAQLLATRDDPAQASRWQMRDLAPGAGYAAALVVETPLGRAFSHHLPQAIPVHDFLL